MTYVVGHSGAESVWKDRYAFAKDQEGSNSKEISLAEVRLHNLSTDCWTVVGNNVYDVTSFVSRHPAGSSAIKEMCGTNASEDYLGEHSGQQEPEMWLEKLKVGTLKP
jgi:cytochrome b involved in lipid metabolism